ncbi:MAG: cysteine dioxygenase family protein [Acidobacteria bacterium]|nr:cysteine dioxygenase family protein [Acidobacteriota bacterium]
MPAASTTHPRPANCVLDGLVRAIDSLHQRTDDPRRLAQGAASILRLFLGHPGLLAPQQRESDPECYRQHVLHVAHDGSFSIVALVWRVGQATAVHDHVSWCAVGVHAGREEEVSYVVVEDAGRAGLVSIGTEIFAAGTAIALVPPGDIHQVQNPGPGEAISIHIYGADVRRLGTSIRQRYGLPILAPLVRPRTGWAV